MAVDTIRPSADVTTTSWDPPLFSQINEVITQPTLAGITTASQFITTTVASAPAEVAMADVSIGTDVVSSVDLWVDGRSFTTNTQLDIVNGTTVIATGTHPSSASETWVKVTYTGSLTQAEVNDLRARFTLLTTSANGVRIGAAYMDVTHAPGAAASLVIPRRVLSGLYMR